MATLNEPKYNVNTMDGSAELDIYVDNKLVTFYKFRDGSVTLSERKEGNDLDLAQLGLIANYVDRWVSLIEKNLRPNAQKCSAFLESVEKRSAPPRIAFVFSVGNSKVVDADFSAGDRSVRFKNRPQVSMNLSNFRHFAAFLRRMHSEASNF